MKDFYEFLNTGNNFFGFGVCLIIVFGGLREIVRAATKGRSRTKEKSPRFDHNEDELN